MAAWRGRPGRGRLHCARRRPSRLAQVLPDCAVLLLLGCATARPISEQKGASHTPLHPQGRERACSLPSSSASGGGRAHGSGNCRGVHRSGWHFPFPTFRAAWPTWQSPHFASCTPSWQMVPLTAGGRQRDGRSHGAYSKLSQPRRRARSGQSAVEAEPQPCPFLAEILIGCGAVLALVVLGLSLTILLAHRRAPAGIPLGRRIWCVQRRTSAATVPADRCCPATTTTASTAVPVPLPPPPPPPPVMRFPPPPPWPPPPPPPRRSPARPAAGKEYAARGLAVGCARRAHAAGHNHRFFGANMWYLPNLGAPKTGDKARLDRELDQLARLGVTNVRIMAPRRPDELPPSRPNVDSCLDWCDERKDTATSPSTPRKGGDPAVSAWAARFAARSERVSARHAGKLCPTAGPAKAKARTWRPGCSRPGINEDVLRG